MTATVFWKDVSDLNFRQQVSTNVFIPWSRIGAKFFIGLLKACFLIYLVSNKIFYDKVFFYGNNCLK